MADLVITAASVISAAGSTVDRSGLAGATITAGQVVYWDPATTRYLLADNNSATAAARVPTGIALSGAASGQPIAVHQSGDITIGATMVAGVVYYLGDVPGSICPVADLAAGEYPSVIGIAKSTTVLFVDIASSLVSL